MIIWSASTDNEKNKLNLDLSQPLDQTVTVDYGIDNYLTSSTFTFNILICDHFMSVLNPMLFSFEIFGEG
jgi:hypothetical protein